MTLQDDGGLVGRLRAGDAAAQRDLYLRCQERLPSYFRHRLPDSGDTDDCVHEVYVRAVEGLVKGNGPTETLDGWLFGIARNLLRQRYTDRRRYVEIPPEVEAPPAEMALELEHDGDLPTLPTDLEFVLGKRELWHTVRAAVEGIGAGLRRVISTHIDLSLREQRKISSAELAAALGMTAEQVDRQLHRARKATADVVGTLVLARTGRSKCRQLAGVLDDLLSPEQQNAGRALVLDQKQATALLTHVTGCAVCGPQASQAREYARWVLGPGLLTFPDDDERRRVMIAFFNQAREGRTLQQSAMSAVAANPVAAAARDVATAAPEPGRLSTAVASWTSRYPVLNNIAQVVQENPITLRVAVGAVALVVVIGGMVTASGPVEPDVPESPVAQAPADPTGSSSTRPTATTVPQPAAQTHSPSPVPGRPQNSTTAPPPGAAPPGRQTAGSTTTTSVPQVVASPTTTTTTSQPPPQPRDIGVDATGTDYVSFGISGTGLWKDARQVQSYRLSPGTHVLLTQLGARIPFTVTDSWTVDYGHQFDNVVRGRGTSTIVVRGMPMTFDTSGTDYTDTAVSGTGWRGAGPVRTLRLLPGPHYVQAPSGPVVRFQVTDAGRVEFDRAFDHVASGRGTSTLTVRGMPVTLDTSGTDYAGMAVSGTGWRGYETQRTLRLLPGQHYVQFPTGSLVRFQVTDAGRVEFESAVDHLASGRGTSTLTVRGMPVTVDISGTDYVAMAVSGTGWRGDGQLRTLRLLPGAHYVQTTVGNVVRFQVTDNGRVEFDQALDHLATGRGTSTLSIRGLPVTFDRSGVDYTYLAIGGIGPRFDGPTYTLRLLPGPGYVQTPQLNAVRFQVTESGRFEFDRGYDRWAGGRGTSTLTVRGAEITIDATTTTHSSIIVSGVSGWKDARREHVVRLMPGKHQVVALGGRKYDFVVKDNGLIDFDSGSDGVLFGRDTVRLTIRRS